MSTPTASTHDWPVTVQWGDCDPAGIIFYPTYYRWMDAATWSLMESVGYTAERMRAEHLTLPLVHTECSFERSPTFGDRCIVRSSISRWGGKSFTVSHTMLRADGTRLAHGSESRVWCHYENGPGTPLRGEPIPDAFKALMTVPAGADSAGR